MTLNIEKESLKTVYLKTSINFGNEIIDDFSMSGVTGVMSLIAVRWVDERVGDEKMETAFLDCSLMVRMKLKEGKKKKSRGRA